MERALSILTQIVGMRLLAVRSGQLVRGLACTSVSAFAGLPMSACYWLPVCRGVSACCGMPACCGLHAVVLAYYICMRACPKEGSDPVGDFTHDWECMSWATAASGQLTQQATGMRQAHPCPRHAAYKTHHVTPWPYPIRAGVEVAAAGRADAVERVRAQRRDGASRGGARRVRAAAVHHQLALLAALPARHRVRLPRVLHGAGCARRVFPFLSVSGAVSVLACWLLVDFWRFLYLNA